MIKIGLLGANGQVGTEVAFYLSRHENVVLSCLIRSEYSAALFKLLSIPYLVVDYADTKRLSCHLLSFDAVLDFSYQAGEISETLKWLKKLMQLVVSHMRPGSKYVYMSSVMAYGMSNPAVHLKNHLFPRTAYAYIKRRAETLASQTGKRHKVNVFNFRLGQIHGSLQVVTQLFLSKLSLGTFRVNGTPQSLTNTVFTYSISDAIMRCIQGEVTPGTHTLVSSPQWTSEDLFSFYRKKYRLRAEVQYMDVLPDHRVRSTIGNRVFEKMRTFRDLAETYLLINNPSISFKIKGMYRIKTARNEISMMQSEKEVYPMLLGPVPDRPAPVVTNVESSADKIAASIQRFEDGLNDTIHKAKKCFGESSNQSGEMRHGQ